MRQRLPRERSPRHLAWIRTLPCLSCGVEHTSEAAHIRYTTPHLNKRPVGMGERPDDKWTVPLCRSCHADQHKHNEREWWKGRGIDPLITAALLWAATGNGPKAIDLIRKVGDFSARPVP